MSAKMINVQFTLQRPMKIGGSRVRVALGFWLSLESDDDLPFVVQIVTFSFKGINWSVLLIGGNTCSISEATVFPTEDADREDEVDAARSIPIWSKI